MSPLHTYLEPEQLLAVRGVACAIIGANGQSGYCLCMNYVSMFCEHVLIYMYVHVYTVPSRKRAHGQCTLHWAKIGGGPIFEVSLSCLYAKERPGKLPMLAS